MSFRLHSVVLTAAGVAATAVSCKEEFKFIPSNPNYVGSIPWRQLVFSSLHLDFLGSVKSYVEENKTCKNSS